MAVVLAPRVRSEREREMAQVERARRKVEEQREDEATAFAFPTADRVAQAVRGALAGCLGEVLTVRVGRGARSETVEFRLVALHRAGALGQTQRGCPVWLAYHDLYCSHATILDPPGARDAMGRAVGQIKIAAPKGER